MKALTPAELERLAVLSEECGEVILAVGKILRHGYNGGWPTANGQNRRDLEKELGHMRNALRMMLEAKDVSLRNIAKAAEDKHMTISQWMHHQ